MAKAAVDKEFSVVVNIDPNIEEQDGASSSTLKYQETTTLLPARDQFPRPSEPRDSTNRSEIELANQGPPAASAERKEEEEDSEPVNPIEREAKRLREIEEDPKLKRFLTVFEKKFEGSSSNKEKCTTRCINTKNELYQMIGFYTVFQGVVLTAVAQTTLIQCQQSWGPASLSVLASVATIVGVYTKLKTYKEQREDLEKGSLEVEDWQSRILLLKKEGKNFKFPETQIGRETSKRLELLYSVAVIVGLILFSGITLASCFAILCHNRGPSPSSAPPSASLSSPPPS